MNKKIIYFLLGIVAVLIIAVVGFKTGGFGLAKRGEVAGQSTSQDYAAVFLSNGQVYFGKLTDINSDWITLDTIYYLQVNKPLQPKPEGEDTTADQPKLSLVKLGNELHGPNDQMTINRQHVIFYESLRQDGKVVQSINKYLEEQANKSQDSSGN